MEELRIWGFNLSAITFSFFNEINRLLSTIALVASIIYTLLKIKDKLDI